jgi:long-chain acyl-CoA synthetase
MTEASPVATSISGMDYINFPDSAGIAHPLNEVIACDPDTMREVLKGEIGELWIRGVNIIKGYWRNPEATKGAFLENGFYRTGDGGFERKEEPVESEFGCGRALIGRVWLSTHSRIH